MLVIPYSNIVTPYGKGVVAYHTEKDLHSHFRTSKLMNVFLPYVYRPEGLDSTYVVLVSPLGLIQIDLAWFYSSMCITFATTCLTLLFWWWTHLRRTKVVNVPRAKEEAKKSHYYTHRNQHDCVMESKQQKIAYHWYESGSKIMIDVEYKKEHASDSISFTWTTTAFRLSIQKKDEVAKQDCLWIKELYGPIQNAFFKAQDDTILITLLKDEKDASTWKSLHLQAKDLDQNIRYDDSLYE